MGAFESVADKAFGLVTQNAAATVSAGAASKLACAFPQGDDPADFGPWESQELRQVFFETDSVTTAAVEIDFRISYKSSAAHQYIDEVFVDSMVKVPVPYSLDARIEFRDANMDQNGDGLEMAIVPFVVTVTRNHPVFGIKGFRAEGELHGDGQSVFNTFDTIDA